MDSLLTVTNLTTRLSVDKKFYNVVDKINFDLNQGQTLAIVGESGCGKSMTAYSLLRILPQAASYTPESQIWFKGQDLLKLSEKQMQGIRGNKISMIFQDPVSALNPLYTIGYQLHEVISTHTLLSHEQAEQKILKTLGDLHLPSPHTVMEIYPHQLSGGMLQRVMIAMALILDPDLLIADEPTTALDVTIQAQILNLLQAQIKKRKMGMIIITHDINVVAHIADEVLVMYAGEKIEQAGVEDLFDHAAHPYTQKLFQAQPTHPLSKAKLPTIAGKVPSLTNFPSGCRFHPRCEHALSICKKKCAPYFSLPQNQHKAKCWLYDQELEAKLDDDDDFRS